MQSPLKRVIVYDLETGGLSEKYNSITEMAGVVVDLESLEIIEEFSVMFLPRMDLSIFEEEPSKEAKSLFNSISKKDLDTGVKTLMYKGINITLKTLSSLTEDVEQFREYLNKKGNIITYDEYLQLQTGIFKDISKAYLDRCYNSEALEITHMTLDLLVNEGVSYEEGFKQIESLVERHTIGNNKPIRAGHNIKGFDDPFMVKLFKDNKSDFIKVFNNFVIDTLEWVRLRWFETAGYSLGVSANALGLTLKEAHRALPDTIANAKLLILMLKSFRGEGSQESTYVRQKYSFNF